MEAGSHIPTHPLLVFIEKFIATKTKYCFVVLAFQWVPFRTCQSGVWLFFLLSVMFSHETDVSVTWTLPHALPECVCTWSGCPFSYWRVFRGVQHLGFKLHGERVHVFLMSFLCTHVTSSPGEPSWVWNVQGSALPDVTNLLWNMRAPTCSTERTLFLSPRPCLLSSDANISARLMGVGGPQD